MLELTKLERAVLSDWLAGHPEDAALLLQLEGAALRERENSGAGYFCRIDPNRSAPTLPTPEQLPRSAAWFDIAGFKRPVGHVLWTTDGFLTSIEGFTIDDSSTDIDWATVEFTKRNPDSI